MPRRRAVRLMGATLVAVAVPGMRPRLARGASSRARSGECGADERACPRSVQLAVGPDLCCGSPARRYGCEGTIFDPVCVDLCGGPDDIPCTSPKKDDDGYSYFQCCKRPQFMGCDDGDCIPDCDWPDPNAGLTPCGKNCCEGSCCDRIFTLKAPFCCDAQDAEKEPWKDAEVASMIAAVALGVLALTVASGGLAAFAIAGLAAGAGLGGVVSKIIGDDPPDPDFKELFHPRVPRMAPVPRKGLSAAAAGALDRLIANRLRFGAYALAYIRSVEKAQGAEKAGDKTWVRRHRKAAAGYAREAAKILARDRPLSAVALGELKRGGFVDTGVSLAQARQSQQRIRQRGLPAETTRVMRDAGVDDKRIAQFRTAVARLDPKLVAGVGVFGSLTDQRLADANTATVKALRRSAAKLT